MSIKVTEIIPDDIPQWASDAIADGQFFRIAIERVEFASAEAERLQQVAIDRSREIIRLQGIIEDVDLPDIPALGACRLRVKLIGRLEPPKEYSDD